MRGTGEAELSLLFLCSERSARMLAEADIDDCDRQYPCIEGFACGRDNLLPYPLSPFPDRTRQKKVLADQTRNDTHGSFDSTECHYHAPQIDLRVTIPQRRISLTKGHRL
jgi:hypothetical protein